jgi:hypothetical protein
MKYLGFYSNKELEKKYEGYITLLAQTSNYEIRIFYDNNHPFISHFFAIKVDMISEHDLYDLFEYVSSASEMEDVKAEIASLAEVLISYKKGILSNPIVKEWIKTQ